MNSSSSKRLVGKPSSSSKRLLDKSSSHAHSQRSLRSSLKKRSSFSVEIEEIDPTVLAGDIMKDILDKALEQIQETYMENQTVKFVVHCAHQALEKMLRIHFYQHNDYGSVKLWGPDKRPEPSSPDSWSFHYVPESKNIRTESELNTLSQIKLDLAEKGGEIVADNRLDVVSLPSETLLGDIRAIIEEILENLPVVAEEEEEKAESLLSMFTMVVEGMQSYEDFKLGPQLSKLSLDSPYVKLPKIDLLDSGNCRHLENLTPFADTEKLPPIRTDANYKCRPLSVHDQPKKSKEKK